MIVNNDKNIKFDPEYSFEEKDDERTTWIEVPDAEPFDAEVTATEYWQTAVEVVNAWSQYRAKAKLYFNATHEETRNAVWHVIVEKYDGDVRNLEDHEGELSEMVNIRLDSFESVCQKFSVDKISRQWLYDNLKDARDYNLLRQKCLRRLRSDKPAISLRSLV